MNLYLVKIKIEYHCEERWIQQKFWNTCHEMARANCIFNLIEAFKDDDAAMIYEDGCTVQKIGQEKLGSD